MVAALGLLLPFNGAISAFGIGLTTATGSLTLAGTLVNTLALTALSGALAKDPPSQPTPENAKANSKVATGDRFWRFGLNKLGGTVAFHRAREGVSYILIVHGHGEVTSFDSVELNAETVEIDESGYVTDDQYQYGGRSRVRVIQRFGLTPSQYYPEIISVWPEWTENHRLDGLSTTLMIIESVPAAADRAMFPNGDPSLTRIIKGAKLLDPRTGVREWSENGALVMARTIEHPDIFGKELSIDWADVRSEADICDSVVQLAAGGSEKLWRLSGSASLMSPPQDILGDMMIATGSRAILKPSGKIAIRTGIWREPVLTLTVDDLLEIQEIDGEGGVGSAYNTASVRYVDPNLNFSEVDIEPYVDLERVERDGGELEKGLPPMYYSPSHRQTRLAAKIKMERDNPLSSFTAFWRPSAIAALSESFVTLYLPSLGITGTFEVKKGSETYKNGNLVGVMIHFAEFRKSAMFLATNNQGEPQPAAPEDESTTPASPQNLDVVSSGVEISQGTYAAGLSVFCDQPVSDAYTFIVEYSVDGSDNWQIAPVPEASFIVQITGVQDGVSYEIRAAFVSPSGARGPYTTHPVAVEAKATVSVPAAPTNTLAVDLTGGLARVTFTSSISDFNRKTQILRDGVVVGEIVSPENTPLQFDDNPGAGTYAYTTRSISVSNVPSDTDDGPSNVTVT